MIRKGVLIVEFEKLCEILVKILGVAPDEITMQTKFAEDLGADSLDMYQALEYIEREFEIEIEQKKLSEIYTVEQAVHYIMGAKNKRK